MAKRRRLLRVNLEPPTDRKIKIRTKYGTIHVARYLKGDNRYEGWYLCDEGMTPAICSDRELGVIEYTKNVNSDIWRHFYRREDVDRSIQRGLLPGEKPDKEEKEESYLAQGKNFDSDVQICNKALLSGTNMKWRNGNGNKYTDSNQ